MMLCHLKSIFFHCEENIGTMTSCSPLSRGWLNLWFLGFFGAKRLIRQNFLKAPPPTNKFLNSPPEGSNEMLNSKTDEKQSWKGEGRMELIIRSRCIFSFQANTNHPGNCQFLFVKRKNAQQFLNSYFHSKFYWYPGMDFFL